MPSSNRQGFRNVFFIIAPDLEEIRGGLHAGPHCTYADFLAMLAVCLKAPDRFTVTIMGSGPRIEDKAGLLEKRNLCCEAC